MEKFSGPASEPWNMKEDTKETFVVPNMEQENSSGIEQLKAENDKLKMALLAAIQDPNDSRGFTYEHLTSEKLDQLAQAGKRTQEQYTAWRQSKARDLSPEYQPTEEQTSLIDL